MNANMLAAQPSFGLFGVDGLFYMVVFLFGTYLSWRALGILKWDNFVHDPFGPQARLFRFILALFGGFIIGLVAVSYLVAAQLLRWIG